MIKLFGVNKFFNKGKKNQIHVINDTTLDFGNKGLIALLGPSGCGKTTLLNAIGGLDKVQSGDIFVNGTKVTGKGASKVDEIRNLNIGYIFQDYKLVDNMTVYENVAIALKMIGIKDKDEIKKRTDYVLETLGIYRYRNRMAAMLSGGERQRVGIARAIAKNPKIIIADEPTGNLDSANTIEIMNIIKAISRDRLVILVTHEVELAKFYASRIIELKDGCVVKDYENITDDSLNYRMDHKFYLKDFPQQANVGDDNVKVNFYGGEEDKLDLNIVIKNGNIYIQSPEDRRIEVIDKHSAIEFVDDHFKEMDKSLYEEYKFDFDKVVDKSITEKYSSIIGFGPSFVAGFKKIMGYPLMKKLLLIGFLVTGVFITYSFSSIYAALDVQDKDFIKSNKDYLQVSIPKVEVSKFLKYEAEPSVEYILPGNGQVNFTYKMNFYYQTDYAQGTLAGSLTDASRLNKEDLVAGRMPEKTYEIVIDKMTFDNMAQYGTTKMVGIHNVDQLLGEKVHVPNMKPFTIVGVTDKVQPLIYASGKLMTDIVYNGSSNEEDYSDDNDTITKSMLNYKTVNAKYTLKQGKEPEEAYEVMIPYEKRYQYPLNKEVERKVNGKKLKVVGYYESSSNLDIYLVNQKTIKYSMISGAKGFMVCTDDKEACVTTLMSKYNLNVKDAYEAEKEAYKADIADMVKITVILGLMILAISLIEILLMIRSSFLSRIKEIGIFRAIGVKKTDIYKMFLGEIAALTTLSSLPGIIISAYALSKLASVTYLSNMFAMNPVVFFGAIIVVYGFNSLVGLIPVFRTMRQTPAAILARYDVD